MIEDTTLADERRRLKVHQPNGVDVYLEIGGEWIPLFPQEAADLGEWLITAVDGLPHVGRGHAGPAIGRLNERLGHA